MVSRPTYPVVEVAGVALDIGSRALLLSQDGFCSAKGCTGVVQGASERGGKAKSKESAQVMTEARRIARNLVKDAMKEEGIKISHVKASEITAAANELIGDDPSIVEQAKANLAAAETAPKAKINIKALIKEDPELVAKAEAKKAKERESKPLSKTQAGKVKPRAGKAQPQATA